MWVWQKYYEIKLSDSKAGALSESSQGRPSAHLFLCSFTTYLHFWFKVHLYMRSHHLTFLYYLKLVESLLPHNFPFKEPFAILNNMISDLITSVKLLCPVGNTQLLGILKGHLWKDVIFPPKSLSAILTKWLKSD